MKHYFITFCCLLAAFSLQAQTQDSIKTAIPFSKKLYIGVGLSNISYMLVHKSPAISGSVEPWVTPHIGYKVTPRLDVQIGIGYGKDKEHYGTKFYENKDDDELTYWDEYNTTWGLTVPLAVHFSPFNPNKRLQLYATTKVVTVFGATNIKSIEKRADVATVSEIEGSETNIFFIGGLLLKYKINKHFDTYVEGNFIYKDLRHNNNYANSRPLSIGIGLNYNL